MRATVFLALNKAYSIQMRCRYCLRRIFLKKQAFHPRNKNTRGFAPALNFYRLCGLSFLFFTFIPNYEFFMKGLVFPFFLLFNEIYGKILSGEMKSR